MKPGPAFATAIATALVAAAGVAAAESDRLERARAEYEVGHYETAFATFAALADEGQCEAARIATDMAHFGRTLYPVAFTVDTERLQRWQRTTGCQAIGLARR